MTISRLLTFNYRWDNFKQHWLLFWKIESDPDVGTDFWDNGTYNVLIRKDDLERMDFSRVHFEMART
jgi:uncharacterized protein YwqG